MLEYLRISIIWFNNLVLGYYVLANILYLILFTAAVWGILKHLMRVDYGAYQESINPAMAPPVSVIIAAFNEEACIVDSVRSLLRQNYHEYEVLVINDGSTDSTLKRLIDGFSLRRTDTVYRDILETAPVRGFYMNPDMPNLIIVDTVHSGKPDSLNVGINVSRAPYFCSVDADTVLETDAILSLMRPIIEKPELIKATGGIVRVVNGSTVENGRLVKVVLPSDSLSRLQIVEYIRSFLFGRAGMSALNSLVIISGTFSMFHKKTVQSVGGYFHNTVTEDMELVLRIHKKMLDTGQKYSINFIPDPICWTEAPRELSELAKQRRRWHTGLAETLYAYRGMFLRPRYGRIGFFALPYQLLIELFGPVIEILGYGVVTASFFAGVIDLEFLMLFLTLAVLLGVFFSTGAILLEEITYKRYPKIKNLLLLLFYGVAENFGYRQIISLWRTQALLNALFRRKKGWEHIAKHGFKTKDDAVAETEATKS